MVNIDWRILNSCFLSDLLWLLVVLYFSKKILFSKKSTGMYHCEHCVTRYRRRDKSVVPLITLNRFNLIYVRVSLAKKIFRRIEPDFFEVHSGNENER